MPSLFRASREVALVMETPEQLPVVDFAADRPKREVSKRDKQKQKKRKAKTTVRALACHRHLHSSDSLLSHQLSHPSVSILPSE